MNTATPNPRSINRWRCPGFIPDSPPRRNVEQNTSCREGLRISAEEFGCILKPVNSNDVGITHPLVHNDITRHLFPRPGLAVSVSRRDIPQALIAFLQKCRKAVELYRATNPPKPKETPAPAPTPTTTETIPVQNSRPNIALAHENAKLNIPENQNAKEERPPRRQPGTSRSWAGLSKRVDKIEIPHILESVSNTIAEAASYLHYRVMSAGPFATDVPANESNNDFVLGLLDAIIDLNGARDSVTEMLENPSPVLAPATTTPSTITPVGETIVDSNLCRGLQASIGDNDPNHTRGEKMLDLHNEWARRLARIWERRKYSAQMCTRVCDSIWVLAERDGYSKEFESRYISSKWADMATKIRNVVRAGGKRRMVGKVAWDAFMSIIESQASGVSKFVRVV